MSRWIFRPWFWIAFAVVVYSPWMDVEVGQGNVASDLAAIESLVERGTFFINDSTFFDTLDKFKRENHFFSQKSPIFHLVGAAIYAPLRQYGFSLSKDASLCLRVMIFVMVILPMGWLLWLIFDHPWMRDHSTRFRILLTLAFALGSLLTPFAVTFNHYVPASTFLMLAVNRLCLPQSSIRNPQSATALGFWISASLACDVAPAFLLGLAVIGALKWQWLREVEHRKLITKQVIGLLIGAAPLLLLYAALNTRILGSPFPPNLHEGKMLYYPGSYWSELKAKAERGEPTYYQASYSRRLIHSTVGHKGIYWMMPLLIPATIIAARSAIRRREGGQLALAFASFPPLTIAVVMYWAFDLSGGAYGIRHCFATIPPLFCVLGLWNRTEHDGWKWVGKTFWPFGIWGCLIAWIGTINPWSHNTFSAYPPLENLARVSLHHSNRLPTDWIAPLIRTTSVTPANGWLDLGIEQAAQGRLKEAESSLKEAVGSDPQIPLPYYHLGIVQDRQSHSADAIATYETLLKLDEKNVGAWNNLGVFALRSGRLELAEAAYARSLQIAPDNVSAVVGMLWLDQAKGKADPNSPKLADALRRYPHDPRLENLARAWGRTIP